METVAATEPAFCALVREACDLVGGQSELARRMSTPDQPVRQQTIWFLLNAAERISAEHAVAIDRATDGRVSKHLLRPDLFDAPAPAATSVEAAA